MQAFLGELEKRAPLKTPAWEATFSIEMKNTLNRHLPTLLSHSFNHKGNIRLKYKHSSVVTFVTTVWCLGLHY